MIRKAFTTKISSVLVLAAVLLTSCSQGPAVVTESTDSTTVSAETTTEVSSDVTTDETTTAATESATSESGGKPDTGMDLVPIEDDEFAQELAALPDVVEVGRIPDVSDKDEYVLVFEMPLDHKDPAKGTFYQRACLKLRDRNAPTVFLFGGYELSFTCYSEAKETVFPKRYNCNFLEAEYRFYGDSTPSDFSYDNMRYMECFTNENASEDCHVIIENVKNVLGGKWVFEGCSKGGCFTCLQAYRHPEDADMFLAEAAMVKASENYPGLYEYAYTKAGDARFGKKKAKEYRDLVLNLQIEAIRYRETMVEKVWNYAQTSSVNLNSDINADILFDCLVLDQIYYWQYCQEDNLEKLKEIKSLRNNGVLKVPVGDFCEKLFQAFLVGYAPWQYTIYEPTDVSSYLLGNYNYQQYREDGNYLYDFSYLRKALAKEDEDLKLYVTEDMEKDIFNMRIDNGVKEKLPYISQTLEDRLKAFETTEKPLVLINGLTDIHRIAEVTECQNPNVYIFNIPEATHTETEVDSLSEEQQKEFDKLVYSILEG